MTDEPAASTPSPVPVSTAPPPEILVQVKGPGIALMISGGIGISCAGLLTLFSLSFDDCLSSFFWIIVGILAIYAQCCVLRGGLAMVRLKSH